jgi:LAS superfamily LD-carboxypeptidase LdcB
MNGQLNGFDNTPAYGWLGANAHRFGFELSYPEGNDHYVYEPWHWRFVGVKLATHLYNQRLHFYDLDQREIDEYLVNIFD